VEIYLSYEALSAMIPQAVDRSFRLGQQREVQVYRLVSRGTLEEMMYMRQLYKSQVSHIMDVEDEMSGGWLHKY